MNGLIKVGFAGLKAVYAIMKLFPTQKKISILSRESNSPSLDVEMLRDKILEMHPDYKVVVKCRLLKANASTAQKLSYGFHVLGQMWHIATSQATVVDTYCIPISLLKHKPNHLTVQMWHSIGTMKKFGYSILDKPEGSSSNTARLMHMHEGYDYILAAGEGYRSHLAEGFNYPLDKIVVKPLPRVEALKDEQRATDTRHKIVACYPELSSGRKNIVYVPTFRKGEDSSTVSAIRNLCNSIDFDKYNLIIKVHPLTDLDGLEVDSAIIDTCFSSFDMLFVADIVVSDYSCIMYEAAVLGKPLYFYDYDYDEYMSSRDIYMDYKAEVPGPICYNSHDLMNTIEKSSYDYARLDSFLRKYIYLGSKHETQDIVEFLFEHISAKQM